MEAVKDKKAEKPASTPDKAAEPVAAEPKQVADMTPQERQQACAGTIQEVLRTYRCRMAVRMVTKPVGDPNYPSELLVTSEPHVLPAD